MRSLLLPILLFSILLNSSLAEDLSQKRATKIARRYLGQIESAIARRDDAALKRNLPWADVATIAGMKFEISRAVFDGPNKIDVELTEVRPGRRDRNLWLLKKDPTAPTGWIQYRSIPFRVYGGTHTGGHRLGVPMAILESKETDWLYERYFIHGPATPIPIHDASEKNAAKSTVMNIKNQRKFLF